ncbi:MAG TPA: YggS family pyridoxal phosphate-dependent enzyme [Tessaracoccus flavescens]|uniref:Pyridoxal phosphate homeostasis protein n=1 Tax=Tessaracoccus flavescens TaxID=399497 RepID=A0A921JQM1_9ACTN|nr:YggS family pyridoxal phosphate-dependent enzyme [Tessaracoccus flavescens]
MSVAENLSAIEARIAEACRQADRSPDDVRLMPVSKTKPPSDVLEVAAGGYRLFGENKVQEAYEKWEVLRDEHPEIEWAIIGHLQTNKAKFVAKFASEFQALSSVKLAAELDKRLQAEGRQLDVLVQINSSGEPQKFGIDPADAVELARELPAFDALRVRGLMTLAVFSDDHAAVGACFQRMVEVQERLRNEAGDVSDWAELSMGMSGDFELAIAHGATTVRVGQAIFGDRLNPNDYWPGAQS